MRISHHLSNTSIVEHQYTVSSFYLFQPLCHFLPAQACSALIPVIVQEQENMWDVVGGQITLLGYPQTAPLTVARTVLGITGWSAPLAKQYTQVRPYSVKLSQERIRFVHCSPKRFYEAIVPFTTLLRERVALPSAAWIPLQLHLASMVKGPLGQKSATDLAAAHVPKSTSQVLP